MIVQTFVKIRFINSNPEIWARPQILLIVQTFVMIVTNVRWFLRANKGDFVLYLSNDFI